VEVRPGLIMLGHFTGILGAEIRHGGGLACNRDHHARFIMVVTIHPMSVRLVMVLGVIDKRLRRAVTANGHNGKKHEHDSGEQPHHSTLHALVGLGKFSRHSGFYIKINPRERSKRAEDIGQRQIL
jgi:hypothetical protein